ncbi:50S ribosomal protein L21 [Patescibacteria group bacterium]|nr:MAG: 50S ribosomal protein L21 [Patescibacteria group bacterium]
MQAVILAGGKQHLVEPNQTLEIDLVSDDAKKLTFEPLMVIDGDKVEVGAPRVKGVVVAAEVLGETKGDKIKVLKFKAKKRVKKLTGHRQRYTQIKVTSIGKAKSA